MAEHRPGLALSVKLVPPARRTGVVRRDPLLARIENAIDQRLILLHAPAGYGKTSVLAQAYEQFRQQDRYAGWISLDESDLDVAHFLSHLVEAAKQAGLKFGSSLKPLLAGGASVPTETLRARLFEELLALEAEFFVFLDDYHLVSAPEIRELINALLLQPFARVHFLVATRHPNLLPISRLRAQGQLNELDSTDLAFSDNEVGDFVRHVADQSLSSQQISRLRHGTEGWAASLQMAGIALRKGADVDGLLDRFSGQRRDISDFLGEEVLQQQSPALQSFLMQTSVLARFNAELCNAVTGRRDARERLDEVEQRNLFVFSLDDEHHWYRYHHLFAEFLQRRLQEHDPEQLAELHRRASQWFEQDGQPVAAIEHAFEAGDTDRAGALLDAACEELFAGGRTSTLMAFSARLPAEMLDRLPRLQLDRAWHAEMLWKFDDARLALARVGQVLQQLREQGTTAEDELLHLEAKLAHREMMLALLQDDLQKAYDLANDWLDQDRTGDPFMCASAGSAVLCAGRELYHCEGAVARAHLLQKQYLQGGALYGIVFHECSAGGMFAARGDLQLALDAYERGIQMAIELQGEHSMLCSVPALVASEIHYERGDLDRAAKLAESRVGVSELGFAENLMAGFLTRAKLHASRQSLGEALEVLENASWFARHYRFDRMLAAVLNEQLRLLLANDQSREAEQLLSKASFTGPSMQDPEPAAREGASTAQEYRLLCSARLWLAEGKLRKVIHHLRPWFTFARNRHCHRSAIRIGALLARAFVGASDGGAARRLLLECLEMGQRGRFIRSFVDEGSEVLRCIADLHRSQDNSGKLSTDYTGLILAGQGEWLAPAADVEVNGVDGAPVDSLSGRDIEILKLGARGLQNADIAGALGLAESTVKWYWQRIFDKFSVRRRTEAIRLARQHQIIH